MADGIKVLAVDRIGGLLDSVIVEIPTDKVVFAKADSMIQVAELMTTETYSALIFDLDRQFDSYVPLVEMLGNINGSPALILVADSGTRRFYDAQETALAHSVNILARLDRPVTKNNLIAAIEKTGFAADASRNDSTIIQESEFIRGLMSDGLSPVFQPKINISSKKLIEVESFARWRMASGGLLGASAVISLARAKGYMDVLTSRMLELSFKHQAKWAESGINLKIAVHINTESLYQKDFLDVVLGLADQYGVSPSDVRLELTENELLAGADNAHKMLKNFKREGFSLTLHDFGTGLTTLLNLGDIPFDELVISRRFVGLVTEDRRARIILESVIELAQKLDMSVTCEGVETVEHLALIAALGADNAQGYLIGKPMSAHEFLLWAEDFQNGRVKISGLA